LLFRIGEWARLAFQAALNQFAEFVAIVALHVDDFNAVAVGALVAHDSGELDLAQAGADFEADGVADVQFL